MKRIASILVSLLLVTSLQGTSASAISFGCSKAQKEAEMYKSRAEIGQKLENQYYGRGMYFDAFQMFQTAVNDYWYWNKTVSKSPKCFSKSYISSNKLKLKSVSVNQTMATRYGLDIAKRNNYGSPNPCFKYLGDDNAYLECSIRNY
jgi:hypothetical protein